MQSSSPDHQEGSTESSNKELSRSHTSAAYQLPLQDQGQHTMYKVDVVLYQIKPFCQVSYSLYFVFMKLELFSGFGDCKEETVQSRTESFQQEA